MSSTIRVYKTKDATTTPVDDTGNATQWTDADDGTFSVSSLDTTGWEVGTYAIHVTRQGAGYSESLPSNAIDLTVNAGSVTENEEYSTTSTDVQSFPLSLSGVGGVGGLSGLWVALFSYNSFNGTNPGAPTGITGGGTWTQQQLFSSDQTNFGIYTYNGTLTNQTVSVTPGTSADWGLGAFYIVRMTGASGVRTIADRAPDGSPAWPGQPYIPANRWSTGWSAGSRVYGVTSFYASPQPSALATNANTTQKAFLDGETLKYNVMIYRFTDLASANGQVNFGYDSTGTDGNASGGAAIEVYA